MSARCVLVQVLAPDGTTARQANDRLNECVSDRRRGLAVWHDHLLLGDPGPLAGRQLSVHPLTFSLSAVGFAAQTSFTLEHYRDVSLDQLASSEPADPRFWWQRRNR
ncbi:MAG TPA: hypothetical protein VGK69_09660 [Gaiellaceae bacterium]